MDHSALFDGPKTDNQRLQRSITACAGTQHIQATRSTQLMKLLHSVQCQGLYCDNTTWHNMTADTEETSAWAGQWVGHRAGQGRAWQGWAGQGRAGQGTGQYGSPAVNDPIQSHDLACNCLSIHHMPAGKVAPIQDGHAVMLSILHSFISWIPRNSFTWRVLPGR